MVETELYFFSVLQQIQGLKKSHLVICWKYSQSTFPCQAKKLFMLTCPVEKGVDTPSTGYNFFYLSHFWANDFLNLKVPKKCDPILVTIQNPWKDDPIIFSQVLKMWPHPVAHPQKRITRKYPHPGSKGKMKFGIYFSHANQK